MAVTRSSTGDEQHYFEDGGNPLYTFELQELPSSSARSNEPGIVIPTPPIAEQDDRGRKRVYWFLTSERRAAVPFSANSTICKEIPPPTTAKRQLVDKSR